MSVPTCPQCGSEAECVDSAYLYHGKSYGNVWRCPTHQDIYVGCHKDGDGRKPKGTLADFETREARKKAHACFDPMWMGKGAPMKREAAYLWLANTLGISRDETHIGLFDVTRCERVVEAMKGLVQA